MTQDKYHHPPYVQLSQAVGINLSSEDAAKLARFVNNAVYLAENNEREACAQVCEHPDNRLDVAWKVAAAIRARGQS